VTAERDTRVEPQAASQRLLEQVKEPEPPPLCAWVTSIMMSGKAVTR